MGIARRSFRKSTTLQASWRRTPCSTAIKTLPYAPAPSIRSVRTNVCRNFYSDECESDHGESTTYRHLHFLGRIEVFDIGQAVARLEVKDKYWVPI